jgi:hypothetical protein
MGHSILYSHAYCSRAPQEANNAFNKAYTTTPRDHFNLPATRSPGASQFPATSPPKPGTF